MESRIAEELLLRHVPVAIVSSSGTRCGSGFCEVSYDRRGYGFPDY